METLPHMALLPGGRSIKVATQGCLYPREYKSTGQATTGQPATHPMDKKRSQTGHRSSLATGQMSITQEFSSQSMTSHQPSSHWSLDLENLNTGENQYSLTTCQPVTGHQTLYQPIVSGTHAMGMAFINNQASSKSLTSPGTGL